MSNTMEYIGEMLPDGRISVDPSIAYRLRTGQKLRIKIEQVLDMPEPMSKKELDPATQRILERMKKAPKLGRIQGSLSREEIYKDRLDDRY